MISTELVIDLLANDLLIAIRFKTMEEAKQAFADLKKQLDAGNKATIELNGSWRTNSD